MLHARHAPGTKLPCVRHAAMEALPIFLDKLVSEAVAISISVSAVLLMGEVIPQAVCTKCV